MMNQHLGLLAARSRINHHHPASGLQLKSIQIDPNVAPGPNPLSIILPSVAVGDLIVPIFLYLGTQPTWTAVANDSIGNVYAQDTVQYGGGGACDIYGFKSIATVAGTNVTVNADFVGGHSVGGTLVVYQFSGANSTINWFDIVYTSLKSGSLSSNTYSVQSGSSVLIAGTSYVFNGSSQVISAAAPQPATKDTSGVAFSNSLDFETWHYLSNTVASGQVTTFSIVPTSQWRFTNIIGVVNPA